VHSGLFFFRRPTYLVTRSMPMAIRFPTPMRIVQSRIAH
jgi:hypothetical protein